MALARLLTFRSLKSRPLRMFFSPFGIILGVAAILSIGITNQTAMDAITRLFEDTSGKADLVVVSRDQKEDGFSERIFCLDGLYDSQARLATVDCVFLLR
jgi:hypothetical protein